MLPGSSLVEMELDLPKLPTQNLTPCHHPPAQSTVEGRVRSRPAVSI